jgi:hypothetical protein
MAEPDETRLRRELRANGGERGAATVRDDGIGVERARAFRRVARVPRRRVEERSEFRTLLGERLAERGHESVAAVLDDRRRAGAEREDGGHDRDADRRLARHDRGASDAGVPYRGPARALDETLERVRRAEFARDSGAQRDRIDPSEESVECVVDDGFRVSGPRDQRSCGADARWKIRIAPTSRRVGDRRDRAREA